MLVLEKVDAEDFSTFEEIKVTHFGVVNHVTELREYGGWLRRVLVFFAWLGLLGDFPDADGAIVATRYQEFLVLEVLAYQAADGVGVRASLLRL